MNIILFDGSDVKLICDGKVSFIDILKFKLRQAGDTGSLLVPYELKGQTEIIESKTPQHMLSFRDFVSQREYLSRSDTIRKIDDLLIFVEGKSDIQYVENVLRPLSKQYFLSYKIEVLEGGLNIRKIPSILNLYGKVKAVIVFLDDDLQSQFSKVLIENVSEQISNSSSPQPIRFFFINPDFQQKLKVSDISLAELRRHQIFNSIENFIQLIAEDFYDPEIDIPIETISNEIERLRWNYKAGVVEYDDEETGHISEITNVEELVEHLEECAVQAMNGQMPLEWLKSQDCLNYSTEVREYLSNYHLNDIRKLGWDENEL